MKKRRNSATVVASRSKITASRLRNGGVGWPGRIGSGMSEVWERVPVEGYKPQHEQLQVSRIP